MPYRGASPAKSIATQTLEMSVAVPQVVAHRLTRMALAGPLPSVRDRREFHRMSAEKVAAFGESWQAMALQSAQAGQAIAASWWRLFWASALGNKPAPMSVAAQMQRETLGVLSKGLAPVHRKATANARRLSGVHKRR